MRPAMVLTVTAISKGINNDNYDFDSCGQVVLGVSRPSCDHRNAPRFVHVKFSKDMHYMYLFSPEREGLRGEL